MPPILRGFRVAVPVCVSAAVSFLSLRCRLLDGSHYTRPTYVVQIKSTQTMPKPLQTLAFIGVSQPHDGDKKTADATATATTSRARRARHGTATATARRTATTGTTSRAQRRATVTTWPRHARPRSHAKERARAIPHDTPKHNRTNVPTLHHATNTPVGEPPARPFCWGRWDNSRNSARVFEKFAHKT